MANIKITSVDAGEALKFTARVVDECGARLAGSDSCKKAAQIIREEMSKFCDAVEIEEFDVHPGSFPGFLKATVLISFSNIS
jgi:hypothetical protein